MGVACAQIKFWVKKLLQKRRFNCGGHLHSNQGASVVIIHNTPPSPPRAYSVVTRSASDDMPAECTKTRSNYRAQANILQFIILKINDYTAVFGLRRKLDNSCNSILHFNNYQSIPLIVINLAFVINILIAYNYLRHKSVIITLVGQTPNNIKNE